MKRLWSNNILFTVGAVGYGALECLWRGRTHWSMLVAGGLCFVMFAHIAERWRERSLVFKATVAALGVTAVEFVFGLIFNVLLHKRVWDYRDQSFNVMGQICPLYSALWGVLALGFVPLAQRIKQWSEQD